MGGGGSYYDRDVSDSGSRGSSGYTRAAQAATSRSDQVKETQALKRKLEVDAGDVAVIVFDVSASMGDTPRVFWDKAPMIAGQIVMNNYLKDPMVSITAVGDVDYDRSPLQIADFSELRKVDKQLSSLVIEGGGGGGSDPCRESYEFPAWFYANRCKMSKAKRAICIIVGDERFRETLGAEQLEEFFGGPRIEGETVAAEAVFSKLKKKFSGNVFLIFPTYTRCYGESMEKAAIALWKKVLGDGYVVKLEEKLAIADTMLGIIALAGGTRTLDEYIEDIKNRPLEMEGKKYEPQSPERIAAVRKSLTALAEQLKDRKKVEKESKKKKKEIGVKSGKEDKSDESMEI